MSSPGGNVILQTAWLALLGMAVINPRAAMPGEEGVRVLVLSTSRVPAYEEALDGLSNTLTAARVNFALINVNEAGERAKLDTFLSRKPSIVVSIGSAATAVATARELPVPIVATMILPAPGGEFASRKPASAVTIEVSTADVLARLKQLYPGRTRIALIRGPALPAAKASLIEAQGRKLGYEIQVLPCQKPKELLDAFASLRGRSDFVWFLPDSSLYQGPTVSALVLAGIRNQLPIIGYSEGLVRAGALVGFYPDYRDVGIQTGESVLRSVEGRPLVAVEYPRKLKVAVNERVMRTLGLRATEAMKGLLTLP